MKDEFWASVPYRLQLVHDSHCTGPASDRPAGLAADGKNQPVQPFGWLLRASTLFRLDGDVPPVGILICRETNER